MTRYRLIPLLLLSALFRTMAFGQSQNSDISLLFGPVRGSTQVVTGTNTSVSTSGALNFNISFAHTIHSYSVADLWFETPFTFILGGETKVSNGVSTYAFSPTLVTPGVRLQVPVDSRVSFYGLTGGGYGSFPYTRVAVGTGVSVEVHHTTHGVFDFGGGMDVRLTRRVSLRAEVRDFVTGQNLGGVSGRNHLVYGFGAALHF